MRLSFHGADRTVTGSCHMAECAGKRILIDCGLFQGNHEPDGANAADFGFDPASIDYVLLTHAHLDHCGRLPLLSKRGFHGEIITTAASKELARLVMLDSAHLQEEEARSRNRVKARRGRADQPAAPLYSILDALGSLDHFRRTATYDRPIELASGVRATFVDAGHILGSASILLEVTEASGRKCVLFSGDLGSDGSSLLRGRSPPPKADIVVMESTYGDRRHRSLTSSIDEFYAAVSDTFTRGGNVIIPTFALERAQEVLYVISRGLERNRLPRSTQVFLDSPMAISATEIMQRHVELLNPEAAALIRGGRDPFQMPALHYTRERAESAALNQIHGGAIIIAGSGMCNGGRVRHHLKHNLWRTQCSVVFVGFAAIGTLARRIIDGAKQVEVLGEPIPVHAGIHTINGFSAHADQPELVAWQGQTEAPCTFLTHGEESAMNSLAALLAGPRIEMPRPLQAFDV